MEQFSYFLTKFLLYMFKTRETTKHMDLSSEKKMRQILRRLKKVINQHIYLSLSRSRSTGQKKYIQKV